MNFPWTREKATADTGAHDPLEIEMLKGLMTLPIEGLKTICLINGGAVIAILTFLGNLVARASPTDPNTASFAALASALIPAIACFSAGIALAVVDLVLAYFVQLAHANKNEELTLLLIYGGSVIAFCSALLFGIGSVISVSSFVPLAKVEVAQAQIAHACPQTVAPRPTG